MARAIKERALNSQKNQSISWDLADYEWFPTEWTIGIGADERFSKHSILERYIWPEPEARPRGKGEEIATPEVAPESELRPAAAEENEQVP
jgi:hypothetical protein